MHALKDIWKDVTILPMTRDDLDEVVRIETASFRQPWSRRQFEIELKNPVSHQYIVRISINNRQRVAGYIIFWLIHGEAHILNIAIHPLFRKRGLARRLLEASLDIMKKKGIDEVYLEVRRSNEPAINLYTSFGFELIYIREMYYGDEDALVMRLNLGDS